MEAPRHILNRQQKNRSRRLWIICAVVAAVLIVVVVVPLAVILPRHGRVKSLPSGVLLPLYIYPVAGAWDPLYEALNKYPGENFTIIVNPETGPGSDRNPGEDYVPAIKKLNGFSNVRTIGYVRTGYANRTIDSVLQDIATYSGWSSNTTGLGVHGIFFDEAPHEYSAAAVDYMNTINQAVKNSSGILSNKLVIHNPGTPPDNRFNSDTTDITVAFEDSYSAFQTQQSALGSLPMDRSRYSFMVHSVPGSSSKLRAVVDRTSQHAQYLFATNLKKNYYESFGSDWKSFVHAVPT